MSGCANVWMRRFCIYADFELFKHNKEAFLLLNYLTTIKKIICTCAHLHICTLTKHENIRVK